MKSTTGDRPAVAACAAIVGSSKVITDAASMARYTSDGGAASPARRTGVVGERITAFELIGREPLPQTLADGMPGMRDPLADRHDGPCCSMSPPPIH